MLDGSPRIGVMLESPAAVSLFLKNRPFGNFQAHRESHTRAMRKLALKSCFAIQSAAAFTSSAPRTQAQAGA